MRSAQDEIDLGEVAPELHADVVGTEAVSEVLAVAPLQLGPEEQLGCRVVEQVRERESRCPSTEATSAEADSEAAESTTPSAQYPGRGP